MGKPGTQAAVNFLISDVAAEQSAPTPSHLPPSPHTSFLTGSQMVFVAFGSLLVKDSNDRVRATENQSTVKPIFFSFSLLILETLGFPEDPEQTGVTGIRCGKTPQQPGLWGRGTGVSPHSSGSLGAEFKGNI